MIAPPTHTQIWIVGGPICAAASPASVGSINSDPTDSGNSGTPTAWESSWTGMSLLTKREFSIDNKTNCRIVLSVLSNTNF